MIKVVINRSKWSRGAVVGNALLVGEPCIATEQGKTVAEEGKMCCLGFVCLTLGFSPDQIRGRSMPSDLGRGIEGLTEVAQDGGDHYDDTNFSVEAAKINDDADISDKSREEILVGEAATAGFAFVFVD